MQMLAFRRSQICICVLVLCKTLIKVIAYGLSSYALCLKFMSGLETNIGIYVHQIAVIKLNCLLLPYTVTESDLHLFIALFVVLCVPEPKTDGLRGACLLDFNC